MLRVQKPVSVPPSVLDEESVWAQNVLFALIKRLRTITGAGYSAVSLLRDSAPCACGCLMSVLQVDRFPINFVFIWDRRRGPRRPMAARHQGLHAGNDWHVNTQACRLAALDERHSEEWGLCVCVSVCFKCRWSVNGCMRTLVLKSWRSFMEKAKNKICIGNTVNCSEAFTLMCRLVLRKDFCGAIKDKNHLFLCK